MRLEAGLEKIRKKLFYEGKFLEFTLKNLRTETKSGGFRNRYYNSFSEFTLIDSIYIYAVVIRYISTHFPRLRLPKVKSQKRDSTVQKCIKSVKY